MRYLAATALATNPDGMPWQELWPRVLGLDLSLEDDWREAAPEATAGPDADLSHGGTNLVEAG